jgi:beta-glucanase (GH16 family)
MLRLLSFFIAFGLTSVAFAQNWTLSWSDEFNGTSIDPAKWGYDIGTGAAQGLWGWGNGELQHYTDNTNNAHLNNGQLIITAREETFAGSSYTSARLVTKNRFSQTHGKWEARIDLPTGQGIWPAFWMLRENNPWPGEIDIMGTFRGAVMERPIGERWTMCSLLAGPYMRMTGPPVFIPIP